MKHLKSITGLFLMIAVMGCSSPTEVVEELTDFDHIQGTWVLQQAIINGDDTPVTNPGLGQIQATFTEKTYVYVFPEIGTNGFPTGNTDSIEGDWSFNEDHSEISLDRSAYDQEPFVWTIKNLANGIFDTEYRESFPGSTAESVFEFSYRPK